MSVDQAKAFFQKVKEDPELAKKIKDAQAAYKGDTSDKDAAIAAVVIPIAAEAGFKFTVDDFKATFEAEGEASEDELDAVAGGNFWGELASMLTFAVCGKTECHAVSAFCSAYNH